MKVSDLLKRARGVLGKSIPYKLGSGGADPAKKSPAGGDGACDCSGFIAWALGFPRQVKDPFQLRVNGGWVNTTSIVLDANSREGIFDRLAKPRPGCLIVYPWRNGSAGHVGIVTEVRSDMPVRVIHCSSGASRRTGDSIAETGADVWLARKDTIYAWFTRLEV